MTARQVLELPIGQVQCGCQVRERFDEESILGLARSIAEVGIQQPLLVRKEGAAVLVVDGERRLRAARQAGLASVPVIFLQNGLSESDTVQRMLIANVQKEDLTAVEKARGIARLIKATGWTASEAASRVGLSAASVSRHLTLLELPDSILSKVEADAIPSSAAYSLAQVSDPAEQAELLRKLESGELNRDGVAGAVKSRKNRSTPLSAERRASKATAVLGSGRTITVQTANLSLETFIQCLDELLAKARKVRPQGLELTTFLKMLQDQAKA